MSQESKSKCPTATITIRRSTLKRLRKQMAKGQSLDAFLAQLLSLWDRLQG